MQSIESTILVTEILSRIPYPLKVKIMKEFLSPKDKCVLCDRKFVYLSDYPSFKIVSIKFPVSFTRYDDPDRFSVYYKPLKDETVSMITKEIKDLETKKSFNRTLLNKIFGYKKDYDNDDDYVRYRKRLEEDNFFNSFYSHGDSLNSTFTLTCKFQYIAIDIFEECIEIVVKGILEVI